MNQKGFNTILVIFLGIFFLSSFHSYSQSVKKTRILFLLDASSSMTYKWNAEYDRFAVASNILLSIVDSVYALNNEVEFAVRAYGTQYASQDKNCTDTRLEVPFNIQNAYQIKTRLANLKPLGFSPIAYSLIQASENELGNDAMYDYSIILINDGGESCNGDVCDTYSKFLQRKIKIKPYVIGLDKNEQLKSFYDCLGNYIEVTTAQDIQDAIKMIVDAHRPLIDKPKVLNLTTQYSNTKKIVDTVVAIAKKDTVVKPKEPELIRSEKFITALKNIRIPTPKDNTRVSNAVQMVLKDQKKASFAIKTESAPVTPPPVVIPIKKITNLEKLNMVKMPRVAKASSFKAKQMNLKAPKKASFALAFATPRDTFVFPKLKMTSFPIKQSEKKIVRAKNVKFKTSKTASFALTIAKPRDTFVFPFLKPIAFPIATKKKPSVNAKEMKLAKGKSSFKINYEVPKKESVIAMRNIPFLQRYTYAFALPKKNSYPISKKNASFKLAFEAKKDSTPKKIIPPSPPSDLEFRVETQNSTETMVQVNFVGPNGKNYLKYAPEIQFKDKLTNQIVTSFKRKVENNNPIPQPIQAGTYDVTVFGFNDLYAKNVKIEPNKLNKVYVKVTEGTLSFAYIGNRNRPIEYKAVVNRRFAEGATIMQNCRDILYYDPGTYYIEVTTIPTSKFSVDLSFGAVYEIQIQQPGNLVITNTNEIGKIQLQQVLGDQFATFMTMNITGDLDKQTLEIQPGVYKIIMPVNPKMPMAGTKVIDFRIKSNQITTLELQ